MRERERELYFGERKGPTRTSQRELGCLNFDGLYGQVEFKAD